MGNEQLFFIRFPLALSYTAQAPRRWPQHLHAIEVKPGIGLFEDDQGEGRAHSPLKGVGLVHGSRKQGG